MSFAKLSDTITFQADFTKVVEHIHNAKQKAYTQINTTLIELYWNIGQTISQKVKSSIWGKGVVSELAIFITQNDPTIKGFSDKNLWRMKQFYETYSEDEKLSPLARELPWTHNTIIFSRCKTIEEREFYLRLAIKEKYTKRELERQIDTSLFERTIIGNQKLSACLRELHPTIDNTFKDSYVLEYAMNRHISPTLIAHYTTMLPDKKILQAKLHEVTQMLERER